LGAKYTDLIRPGILLTAPKSMMPQLALQALKPILPAAIRQVGDSLTRINALIPRREPYIITCQMIWWSPFVVQLSIYTHTDQSRHLRDVSVLRSGICSHFLACISGVPIAAPNGSYQSRRVTEVEFADIFQLQGCLYFPGRSSAYHGAVYMNCIFAMT
jgi:hypothetical protein